MRKHLWKVLFVVVVVAVLAAALCACGIVDKIKDAHGSDYTPQSSDDPDYVRGCNITVDYQDGSAPFVVNVDIDRTFYIGPSARHGYTFLGYFDEPTGGVQYTDNNGTSLPGMGMVTKSFNLYAHYTPLEFSLRFDAGDGDLLGENKRVLTYASDVSAFPVAQMDNYDFVGWYTADDKMVIDEYGDCVYTTFGGDFAALFDDYKLTLYAHYDVKKYKVTFVLNDGTGESVTVSAPYGSAIADAAPALEDTDSKAFCGWATHLGGDPVQLGAATRDETYYALWYGYKFVYFYVNPTDKSPAVIKKYVDDGKAIDFPTEDEIINKGYKLVEWYDNPNYSGVPVPMLSYAGARDKYYAKWEETDYVVTFVTDGAPLDDLAYRYGDSRELPAPERDGYVFGGWSEKEDLTGDLMYAITPETYGNKTLYAKYTPNVYQVTLRKKNGDGDIKVNVKYGARYTLMVPERTGYDFLGWYDEETGGTKMVGADGKSVYPYATLDDSTFYAHWQAKGLTVTFVPGGEDENIVVRTRYGERISAPLVASREGLLLDGWYLDEEAQTPFVFETQYADADVTLYAHWIESVGISSSEGFLAIAQNPNGNYHLECDVNMMGKALPAIDAFGGILNGRGYTVSNFSFTGSGATVALIGTNRGVVRDITFDEFTASALYSDRTDNPDAEVRLAFFCVTNAGRIVNCTISRGSVAIGYTPTMAYRRTSKYTTDNSDVYAGALCVFNDNLMHNCHVLDTDVTLTVNVSNRSTFNNYYMNNTHNSTFRYGTLAGRNNGSIEECTASGTVVASATGSGYNGDTQYTYENVNVRVGGAVGENSGTIARCTADYRMTATGEQGLNDTTRFHLALLVCGNDTDAAIREAAATGKITVGGTYQANETRIGGMTMHNGIRADMRDCYADVEITLDNACQHVGGLTAENAGAIMGGYANVKITANAAPTTGLGGLTGRAFPTGNASNCFVVGTINTPASGGLGYIAGAVDANATFAKCVYADDFALGDAVVTQANPSGVSQVAASDLLSADYLTATLNFNEIVWRIADGQLPTLRWMAE